MEDKKELLYTIKLTASQMTDLDLCLSFLYTGIMSILSDRAKDLRDYIMNNWK